MTMTVADGGVPVTVAVMGVPHVHVLQGGEPVVAAVFQHEDEDEVAGIVHVDCVAAAATASLADAAKAAALQSVHDTKQ
jgi:hypothetical protein